MRKRIEITIIVVFVLALSWWVYSQFQGNSQPAKTVKTVGILYFRQHKDAYDGLKQGMKDLGYNDKNLKYDEVSDF